MWRNLDTHMDHFWVSMIILISILSHDNFQWTTAAFCVLSNSLGNTTNESSLISSHLLLYHDIHRHHGSGCHGTFQFHNLVFSMSRKTVYIDNTFIRDDTQITAAIWILQGKCHVSKWVNENTKITIISKCVMIVRQKWNNAPHNRTPLYGWNNMINLTVSWNFILKFCPTNTFLLWRNVPLQHAVFFCAFILHRLMCGTQEWPHV